VVDWFVVARLPTAEAYKPVEALRQFFVKNSVLVISVLLVILIPLLVFLLRPLTQASAAIQAMAEGRRELEELPEGRADEVGQLVRGFNQLVRRLREKEQALLASEARLSFMAQHDPLTGLPNRMMFEDRFDQAVKRCQRHGSELALLFCDLDGFKLINDMHGHQAGDAVLREVAARLSAGRRAEDTVARLGGDEFVLLLGDQSDARTAARLVGEQCLHAVSEPYVLEEGTVTLGLSIGVAVYRGGGSATHLLTLADAAMYQAKRAGKGRLVFVSEDGQDATGSYLPPSSNHENHS
jgi:diguanylate cyclase (GGDEF)-like protein